MTKRTFENSLNKLEQITDELEKGDLSLEKSLKKFDEGITLVGYCNSTLSAAKSKVELLLEKQGEISRSPFDELEHGDQELP